MIVIWLLYANWGFFGKAIIPVSLVFAAKSFGFSNTNLHHSFGRERKSGRENFSSSFNGLVLAHRKLSLEYLVVGWQKPQQIIIPSAVEQTNI
jgi:hypothetical protein